MEISSFKLSLGDTALSFDSFNIEEDKINIIIGESGSGKTSVLRYLIGCFTDDQILDGCFVSAENFFLFKNIFKNFDLNDTNFLRYYSNLFNENLNFFEKHDTESLSFGQRTRFKLIRSALSSKKIILYDEPTHGLDQDTKKRVISFFKELNKSKILIIASHDSDLINISENVIKI